ncbi:MAG: hypothetical protein N3D17_02365 [bacterium]|nr:hypothetical protein [bacterium]
MIEINIIRTRLERFKNRHMVFNLFLIYFAGLFFLLGFLLIVFLSNRSIISKTSNEIENIQQKIISDKEKFDFIKQKDVESQEMLKSINFFINEKEKRIEWAPILNFVGENVPSGIWLERFYSKEVDNRPQSTGDRGEKSTVILISGYVFREIMNERESIDKFVKNLTAFNGFKDVYLKEVKKIIVENTEVISFLIECEIKGKKGKNAIETSN